MNRRSEWPHGIEARDAIVAAFRDNFSRALPPPTCSELSERLNYCRSNICFHMKRLRKDGVLAKLGGRHYLAPQEDKEDAES